MSEQQAKQKPPAYKVGDAVDYFRRGICYEGRIQEDLGIHQGAGRKYRITSRLPEIYQSPFILDVAERWLCSGYELPEYMR